MIRRCRHVLGGALCALGLRAGVAGAQTPAEAGTVVGRVVDAATQQPLTGASVFLVGTTRGTVAGGDGSYRIVRVPAGSVQPRAQRIGYTPITRPVTVPAGGTATADFALPAAAVQLEQVVTTATGQQSRREFGNVVAIANANDVDPKTDILSNAELFTRARAQFDTALTTGGTTTADQPIRNLAAVRRGRALLDLNCYAEAATAVSAVPATFVYNTEYSQSSIVNAIFDWMNTTLNFAPVDREGGNGLDFVSAADPRLTVRVDAAGKPVQQRGQDGAPHLVQTLYTRGDQPVPLATGVEARLIEAEAALAAGNATTFLSNLNAARATRTGLVPLAHPGSILARQNLVFRERAFWMWGTAHRLGDLRRLIRQYGRDSEAVFPAGAYIKGGSYGKDVNIIPSQAERNNPDYQGCTDRKA